MSHRFMRNMAVSSATGHGSVGLTVKQFADHEAIGLRARARRILTDRLHLLLIKKLLLGRLLLLELEKRLCRLHTLLLSLHHTGSVGFGPGREAVRRAGPLVILLGAPCQDQPKDRNDRSEFHFPPFTPLVRARIMAEFVKARQGTARIEWISS